MTPEQAAKFLENLKKRQIMSSNDLINKSIAEKVLIEYSVKKLT